MKQTKLQNMVLLALFVAIIALMSFVPYLGYIKVPFLAIQATTIHIPVIIGSIILGPKRGAVLGAVFGLTSLINNTFQPGLTSFCFSPFIQLGDGLGGSPLALIVCFIPRILCGIVPYYVYKLIEKTAKSGKTRRSISLPLAAIAGSMTNTIAVMSLIYIFFGQHYAAAKDIAYEAVLGVIASVISINGTAEAIVSAVIATSICAAIFKIKKM